MKPREQYVLVLTPETGWRAPAIVRLRALLKAAKRQFGMKAMSITTEARDRNPRTGYEAARKSRDPSRKGA